MLVLATFSHIAFFNQMIIINLSNCNIQAILFVYDITNKNSFENLQDWVAMADKQFATSRVKPFYGLIGNKGVCMI